MQMSTWRQAAERKSKLLLCWSFFKIPAVPPSDLDSINLRHVWFCNTPSVCVCVRVCTCVLLILLYEEGILAQVPIGLIPLSLSDRQTQHTWKYAQDRNTTKTQVKAFWSEASIKQGKKLEKEVKLLRFAFLAVFSLLSICCSSPRILFYRCGCESSATAFYFETFLLSLRLNCSDEPASLPNDTSWTWTPRSKVKGLASHLLLGSPQSEAI